MVEEAPKPPSRGVGVGSYDVNMELYTEADVSHTIAEHVKRVREKEIQTWIKGEGYPHNVSYSRICFTDYGES